MTLEKRMVTRWEYPHGIISGGHTLGEIARKVEELIARYGKDAEYGFDGGDYIGYDKIPEYVKYLSIETTDEYNARIIETKRKEDAAVLEQEQAKAIRHAYYLVLKAEFEENK